VTSEATAATSGGDGANELLFADPERRRSAVAGEMKSR